MCRPAAVPAACGRGYVCLILPAKLRLYSAAFPSAMAKLYASEIGLEVVNQALQIHGGNGYIKGAYIVERAYRDAKICTIYEGTSEIQKVVISAAILGKMPKSPVAVAGPMAKKGPIT